MATEREWTAQCGSVATASELLRAGANGVSMVVESQPASGLTAIACDLAKSALAGANPGGFWAPVLVLAPGRRRAEAIDQSVTRLLANANGDLAASLLDAPGAHRLVRSVGSYAMLVADLWATQRKEPVAKIPFLSGVDEDARVQRFLDTDAGGLAVAQTPALRMELRNLVARSGQLGISPQDLDALGVALGRPLWRTAARLFRAFAGEDPFGAGTANTDSARIPRVAANMLADWDATQMPAPVPRLLIVDDVQDMTASAAALVARVATMAQQTVILSSPTSAQGGFHGGRPSNAADLAKELGLPRVTLDPAETRGARPLLDEIESWLKQPSDPDATDVEQEVSKSGFRRSAARANFDSSVGRRDESLVATLRRANMVDSTPWERMAVLVRNADEVDQIRRSLQRADVPLAPSSRPVRLASIPVCGALLGLLAAGDEQVDGWGTPWDRGLDEPAPGASGSGEPASGDPGATNEQVMELLSSPLVDADPLEVFRLIRDLRSLMEQPLSSPLELLELDSDQVANAKNGKRSREKVIEQVGRAATLWRERLRAAEMPATEGLWHLWQISDCEQRLVERERSATGAHLARESLDGVIALLRKADLWEQKVVDSAPDCDASAGTASARRFAREELSQTVSSDSLVKGGLTQPGVTVTTATGSVGGHWDLVCIMGPQSGQWPRSGGHSFARVSDLDALAQDARARGWVSETDMGPFIADLGVVAASPRQRWDEAALFNLAVSRASRVEFFVLDSPQDQPSAFMNRLIEAQLVERVCVRRDFAGMDVQTFVAKLRRTLADFDQDLSDAGQVADARSDAAKVLAALAVGGVSAADPSLWGTTGSISTDDPLVANSDERLRLSPSRIADAMACPLKWFMSSARLGDQDVMPEAGWSPSAWGTLVHEIAERHPNGSHDELMGALERGWESLGFERETHWGRRQWDAACAQIAVLAKHTSSSPGQVLVEQSMKFEAGPAVVSGRIDRIEVGEDGKARVVDIKTGSPIRAAEAQENPQLLAYQIGVAEKGYTSAGAALLQLKGGANSWVEQDALDAGGVEQSRSELAALAESLAGSSLQANASDSHACDWCDFRRSCPAVQEGTRGIL